MTQSAADAEVLQITQGADPRDGPRDSRLLLGFWFGEESPGPLASPVAEIGLRPIGRSAPFEGWWYRGDVDFRECGGVRLAECEHYTAALVQKPEADPDALRGLTRDAYIELYDALGTSRHSNVVRIWNYFSDINRGGDDLERYRQFSIGRAEAFQELGLADQFSPPGTAIGTVSGNTLTIVALASNHRFHRLENPRQISAYRYPRQYGPRSPKFSRGGVVSISDHHLFLISGTAAIVGHESAHPEDAGAQATETLRNIETLLAQSNWSEDARQSRAIRVYLRSPADYPSVAAVVERSAAVSGVQAAYLQGDICRAELLVEIDGAFCRD